MCSLTSACCWHAATAFNGPFLSFACFEPGSYKRSTTSSSISKCQSRCSAPHRHTSSNLQSAAQGPTNVCVCVAHTSDGERTVMHSSRASPRPRAQGHTALCATHILLYYAGTSSERMPVPACAFPAAHNLLINPRACHGAGADMPAQRTRHSHVLI
jgi:hypothetical protein